MEIMGPRFRYDGTFEMGLKKKGVDFEKGSQFNNKMFEKGIQSDHATDEVPFIVNEEDDGDFDIDSTD